MEKKKETEKKEIKKERKSVRIVDLEGKEALSAFMSNDLYCTTELPEYFDFSGVLEYAARSIGDKTLEQCAADGCNPETLPGVNLNVLTNKDGKYAVRPLTLANPFLYYMLARDICGGKAWKAVQECFKLYGSNRHIRACAIPRVKTAGRKEPFKNATAILNWWKSMEQRSLELSLKYRYMFITDITNCFGQINPEQIADALARKDTPHETSANAALAARIQRYLRTMQKGKNIGIPQGSSLFALIAEIVLGYTDMLLSLQIAEAKKRGTLAENLEYEIIRYVDDYRIFCNDPEALVTISYMLQHLLEEFNFRMNTSKTRTSTDLITDTLKPDKAFYIFNTPIIGKQTYTDEKGIEHTTYAFDFAGFQKHLLFIFEFSKRYPNSGQLVRQLEELSERIEDFINPKSELEKRLDKAGCETVAVIGADKEKEEEKRFLWENISAMVAIAVEIAANNLRAAQNALKVASQLLANMRPSESRKKKEIIHLIYEKLKWTHNSAFLQVWMQNITHTTDDWSAGDVYDMPLCRVVAGKPVTLWNNSWLRPGITAKFPQESIVDRDALSKTGQVITFKSKRRYNDPTEE